MRLGKDFLGGFGYGAPKIVGHLHHGVFARFSQSNCGNTGEVDPYITGVNIWIYGCQLYEVHGVLICLVLCTQCTTQRVV